MSKPLVFLSYGRENETEVATLRQQLLESEFDVWWDQDILGGQDWKFEIRQAMRDHQSQWNAAMRHYRMGEWEEGGKLFKSYLGKFPQDRPGRHFLRLCRQRTGQ